MGAFAVASALTVSAFAGEKKDVDWAEVRKAIAAILEQEKYDDGSIGPVLVRLAWHSSGTFDKTSNSGGSNGATMRFSPESGHGANAGLEKARAFLEPIKAKFPGISYADLWIFAGDVAIEEMGGPKIAFTPGRTDAADGKACPPDGRLPDASQGAKHVRDVFYRMGFNDREIVALLGAHCLGRCHTDRSGFDGPWTRAPTTFSNLFYKELLENKWEEKKWAGPKQYANAGAGDLMMLPADLSLATDPEFRKHVEFFAKDEQAFFNEFGAAWTKLVNNGVKFPAGESSSTSSSCIRPFVLIGALSLLASKNK